jgi:hypothetical protein
MIAELPFVPAPGMLIDDLPALGDGSFEIDDGVIWSHKEQLFYVYCKRDGCLSHLLNNVPAEWVADLRKAGWRTANEVEST